jgi:hypothetical protein
VLRYGIEASEWTAAWFEGAAKELDGESGAVELAGASRR